MSRAKRKPLEFFKFFWRDFNRDTAHLSRAQRDGYLQVICAYYDNHGALHENAVMKASGATSEEWIAERDILAVFFSISDDGYWTHKRIENELKSVRETAKKRANSGRAGGIAKSKSLANAKQMLSKRLATEDVSNEFAPLTVTNRKSDSKIMATLPRLYVDKETRDSIDEFLSNQSAINAIRNR